MNTYPQGTVLADVDGDGDLDLATVSPATSALTLNPEVAVGAVGNNPLAVAAGDVDGDGDLDPLAASQSNASVSIRLNQSLISATLPKQATVLALFPNPATRAVTLTNAAPHAAIEVLDALGRPVLRATAEAGGTAHLALPAGLAPGVYVVRNGGQARRLGCRKGARFIPSAAPKRRFGRCLVVQPG